MMDVSGLCGAGCSGHHPPLPEVKSTLRYERRVFALRMGRQASLPSRMRALFSRYKVACRTKRAAEMTSPTAKRQEASQQSSIARCR